MYKETTQTNNTAEFIELKKKLRIFKRYFTDIKKILETLRKISTSDPAPPGYVGYFLEMLDDKFEKLENRIEKTSSKGQKH